MIEKLECPRCGEAFETSDLNEHGREMLERRGPPTCPKCSTARMRLVWEGAVTQLNEAQR